MKDLKNDKVIKSYSGTMDSYNIEFDVKSNELEFVFTGGRLPIYANNSSNFEDAVKETYQEAEGYLYCQNYDVGHPPDGDIYPNFDPENCGENYPLVCEVSL